MLPAGMLQLAEGHSATILMSTDTLMRPSKIWLRFLPKVSAGASTASMMTSATMAAPMPPLVFSTTSTAITLTKLKFGMRPPKLETLYQLRIDAKTLHAWLMGNVPLIMTASTGHAPAPETSATRQLFFRHLMT